MKLRHPLLGQISPTLANFRNRRGHLNRRALFGIPDLSSLSPFGSNGSKPGGDEQTYHERKILPYTRKQVYELVADVDNYHLFVPYCTASRVLKSKRLALKGSSGLQDVERKDAELTVGFLAFKESYVSEVTCRPYLSVEAVASSSTPLFKKLITTWSFQPAHPLSPHPTQSGFVSPNNQGSSTEDGSDGPTLMSIDLAFAFSNPVYAGVSAAFFKQVSAMMVQAFENRCIQVYGRGVK